MQHAYDVFNGDADGLCALVQLRLAEPRDAELITGVKRDIGLLVQVPDEVPVEITVLDISLDKNRDALARQLAGGSQVLYIDHHDPGENIQQHPKLQTHIDVDAQICTSLIVDRLLAGRFHNWAIAAAFGDNLNTVGEVLSQKAGLDERDTEQLKTLGACLNYNGYGATLDDLHFHPAELYRAMVQHEDPFAFMRDAKEIWQRLHDGYQTDLSLGLQAVPEYSDGAITVVRLPDEPWARRVSGPLGNELCNRKPDCAIAVLSRNTAGNFTVSIRAPLTNRIGANEVAKQFATGGGRKAAAGINDLPGVDLCRFIDTMKQHYSG